MNRNHQDNIMLSSYTLTPDNELMSEQDLDKPLDWQRTPTQSTFNLTSTNPPQSPSPPIYDSPQSVHPHHNPASLPQTLHTLTTHCTTTHASYKTAVEHLEALTHVFITTSTPLSRASRTQYLSLLNMTRAAGFAVFEAQKAYRGAVSVLRDFVGEEVLCVGPGSSSSNSGSGDDNDGIKTQLREAFEHGVAVAKRREEGVGAALRGLAERASSGVENFALVMYLECLRRRMGNWEREGEELRGWAGEGIGALL